MTTPGRDWERTTKTYRVLRRTEQARDIAGAGIADRMRRFTMRVNAQFLPHYGAGVPKWRLWVRKFGGPRTLPDFACIGAIKSGTTDLCAYLLQHPCILPPLAKEIKSTNPEAWRRYYPTIREKERVAREHGKALSGYFNPMLHSLWLMDNYRAARPDAKIVLLLRNPADRAYSQYRMELLQGEGRLSRSAYFRTFAGYIDLALRLFPTVPAPTALGPQILPTGIYVEAVRLWCERFGRENVHIVRSEDFFQDIPSAVRGIHEFLGVPAIAPEVHGVVHKSPVQAPPLDPETRSKLVEFYRPWNEKLYDFIGRDMQWE